MRKTTTKFAAVLAGVLMAVASPAITHAQSPQSSDSTPRLLADGGIKNVKSGKFLQPTSAANGAKVTQQPESNAFIQRWEIYFDGDYLSFENKESLLNLGINRASTSAGAEAITAIPAGDHNQDWERIWGPNGDYFTLKNRNSGLCLGISGASTATGAQAAQFRCDGTTNQRWVHG
ncbi:RICIN domain-containing protein [Streptomyces ipomoeae]|uniref:RICIN domain-containing protein n=1 Tax=Streptomyces ipomoeae TaxID=103232 RepID=UPI0009969FE5|nr:RICIN domain-containing protein [Streptomyces ipomoeae]MDX2692335.1 RICIN domain-containing protein [Streptomyces ipomoeae]MDX2837835.1 RICIN domain-containing protein [Streptomyces ipomoeae]